MQLLLVVIYVLAQLLGNGEIAANSDPASSPPPAKYNYLILQPDCTPVPVEKSDDGGEFPLVNYPDIPGRTQKPSCGWGNSEMNNLKEAVYRTKREDRPRIAVYDI